MGEGIVVGCGWPGVAVGTGVLAGGGVAVGTGVSVGGRGVSVGGRGVLVGPLAGDVGEGVAVGTVWKSGAWLGRAHAPGSAASGPNATRPAAIQIQRVGKRFPVPCGLSCSLDMS